MSTDHQTSLELTSLVAHPAIAVGEVDPRLFGGFLEHLGRAVYGGVYDPDSAHADRHGYRTDVLDALRGLDMTVMRYPGGNFVSGYDWRDGVGPVEHRPLVRDLAWRSAEPNTFGTDEFLRLSEEMGWTPMMAVNLGTGSPSDAADLVEYCNGDMATREAQLRRQHGREAPWSVPLWCLGNEMDGPWQIGHTDVERYGTTAQQAAMQMRLVDPSIETVVSGSSTPLFDTYGHWDRRALELVGDAGDHLSLHFYAGDHARDVQDYLGVGVEIDAYIDAADAVCRHVAATSRRRSRPWLCFDEWNVWYRSMGDMDGRWQVAPPLLEEHYDLADALVVAQFLNSFLRHADVVKIANLAQIVNVIAPVMTRGDDLLLQSIYHSFRMFSQRRTGTSLRIGQTGPTLPNSRGPVPAVDASIVTGDGVTHLFVVNRSVDRAAPVRLDWPSGGLGATRSAELLTAAAPDVANTWDVRDAVIARAVEEVQVSPTAATFELPPHSLAAVSFDTIASPR